MSQVNRVQHATLEDVRIMFRNFAGKPDKFNPAGGRRQFSVFLDPETAEAMRADGWNIKQLKPREEDDIPQDYIIVRVNYNGRPPRAVMITSKGKTALDEETVQFLDWVDIESSDVIIRPYHYDVNGRTGITAYLQSIYVTIREDYLERKYAEVPDALPSGGQQLELEEDYIEAEIIDEGPREIGS